MLDESKFNTLMNRQQESGLSIKEFCSNEGIAPSSFYYWKKKLRKNPPLNGFIPLVVKSSRPATQRYIKNQQTALSSQEQTSDDTLLEVVYPNGAFVRIKKDIDLSRLRALIYLYD
jgi:SOS-response transcriptional repressor LexA